MKIGWSDVEGATVYVIIRASQIWPLWPALKAARTEGFLLAFWIYLMILPFSLILGVTLCWLISPYVRKNWF